MKIKLNNIKKHYRVLATLIDKNQYDVEHNQIYFDFEEKVLKFKSSNSMFGKLKFDYEGDPPKNFSVSADSFLKIANVYDEIEFEKGVFFNGKDRYNLTSSKKKYAFPPFVDELEEDKLYLSEDVLKRFKNAKQYIDMGIFAPEEKKCIFIIKNRLIATDSAVFYEYFLSGQYKDVAIPFSLVNVINLLNKDQELLLTSFEDRMIYVSIDNELFLMLSLDTSLSLGIDPSDSKFIAAYDHKEFIKINREEFLEIINFLYPFVSHLPDAAVLFEFNENGIVKLLISSSNDVRIDFNQIERCCNVEYSNFNYFKGKNRWFSAKSLKLIFSHLTSEEIILKVDFDKPAMEVYSDDSLHVICTLILIGDGSTES